MYPGERKGEGGGGEEKGKEEKKNIVLFLGSNLSREIVMLVFLGYLCT